MPDESPVLPTSRIARWIAIAAAIAFTVTLYFREGLHLQPLTNAPPPAAPPAGPTGAPATGQPAN